MVLGYVRKLAELGSGDAYFNPRGSLCSRLDCQDYTEKPCLKIQKRKKLKRKKRKLAEHEGE